MSNMPNYDLLFTESFRQIEFLTLMDECTVSDSICKLVEEIGELTTEVNKTTGRKKHNISSEQIKENILEESADCMQNIISICCKFGITQEELLKTILHKNKKWHNYVNKRS